MTRSPKGQPRWHPITALPLIGRVIDEGVEGAERQYCLLLEAKHRPRVLDDHTVQRTLEVVPGSDNTNRVPTIAGPTIDLG